MSNHAVIFADEIGLPEALPLQDDEFICPSCNLVAHEHRERITGFCDECHDDLKVKYDAWLREKGLK